MFKPNSSATGKRNSAGSLSPPRLREWLRQLNTPPIVSTPPSPPGAPRSPSLPRPGWPLVWWALLQQPLNIWPAWRMSTCFPALPSETSRSKGLTFRTPPLRASASSRKNIISSRPAISSSHTRPDLRLHSGKQSCSRIVRIQLRQFAQNLLAPLILHLRDHHLYFNDLVPARSLS